MRSGLGTGGEAWHAEVVLNTRWVGTAYPNLPWVRCQRSSALGDASRVGFDSDADRSVRCGVYKRRGWGCGDAVLAGGGGPYGERDIDITRVAVITHAGLYSTGVHRLSLDHTHCCVVVFDEGLLSYRASEGVLIGGRDSTATRFDADMWLTDSNDRWRASVSG